MKTRTFAGFMFLLLVFISFLLILAGPGKQEAQKKDIPAGETRNDDKQAKSADGNLIWESVSKHLLSAVQ